MRKSAACKVRINLFLPLFFACAALQENDDVIVIKMSLKKGMKYECDSNCCLEFSEANHCKRFVPKHIFAI